MDQIYKSGSVGTSGKGCFPSVEERSCRVRARPAYVVWNILPNDSFRRLQDHDQFLLTPFERNLEVWRQLWRVIERSHLVVQIVDARNPLKFRCEDLESYVQDVEGAEGEQGTGKGKRKNLLLINKADLLTAEQRSGRNSYYRCFVLTSHR
jgi:hypothetical protein